MNRRDFSRCLASSAIVLLSCRSFKAIESPPELAITIDDFAWDNAILLSPQERNRRLLEALASRGTLKSALFVTGKHLEDEAGRELLSEWDQFGHLIGNHSYSHKYFHNPKITVEEFAEDITKAEAVLKGFAGYQKIFRFPYLKEGDTIQKRDALRAFLKKRGYRNGYVTIDASDWAVDARLRKRLENDPETDLKPYREFYLEHMWERANFYNELGLKVLGRNIRHTILIHYNLLNALFLGDLIDMFKSHEWRMIDAKFAFKDPVFSLTPAILPAGESIIWGLAKETGKFEKLLRYPGEDSKLENAKMDKLGL